MTREPRRGSASSAATFNPPHIGHLLCAQEARHGLGLDRVVLMPARVSPHKVVVDDPGADHRFEMCRLACGGEEWLEAVASSWTATARRTRSIPCGRSMPKRPVTS